MSEVNSIRLIAKVPIAVTALDFQGIIESNGCGVWADDLRLTKTGARLRQWRENTDRGGSCTWHTITPRKIAQVVVGLFTGRFTEAQCPAYIADTIRNLWLAPSPGSRIASEDAGYLIQLACFGEIVYG